MQPESSDAKILVVDDNPLITKVISNILDQQGYSAITSANGEEALAELKKQEFDLILCDIMMPKMDGHSFYSKVQGDKNFSSIPFVFLTALDSEKEIYHGKEAGVDDYLVKPFNPEQVLSVVKGKLKRSKILNNRSNEKYDAYRKKIIHTLSHEFRTPLVAINTGAELLHAQSKNADLEDRFVNLLEAIKRGGERLENLVNDFMLVQQIEAGVSKRMYESRKEIRSVQVLLDFAEQERAKYEELGFSYEVKNLCPDSIKLEIYEVQICDVIKRILSNAAKFQKKSKEIEIMIYPQMDEVVFSVKDRGLGVNVEATLDALEIFGQINRDKLEQQGGGFGLAISNQYLLMHGGRLKFENREDGGSIVSFILPTTP